MAWRRCNANNGAVAAQHVHPKLKQSAKAAAARLPSNLRVDGLERAKVGRSGHPCKWEPAVADTAASGNGRKWDSV